MNNKRFITTTFTILSIIILFLTVNVIQLSGSNSTGFHGAMQSSDTLSPEINHEMLRMFEEFKERGTISETFYFRLIQDSATHNPERWRQLLEEYRGAKAIGEDPLEQQEFVELINEEVKDFVTQPSDELSPSEAHTDSIAQSTYQTKVIQPAPADQALQQTDPAPDRGTSIVRYHIQLAASIDPLDDAYLARLYEGPMQIIHFKEEKWNKYYIGHYDTFKDAREELKKTLVTGAFIIAYVLDQRLIAYKARQVEKVFATTNLQTFFNDEQDRFRVQIAASKRPLKEKELERIYPQVENVGIIYENEWYKYSIAAAGNLSDSWKIARSTQIEGAYVVRYQKGKSLPLR